MTSLIWQAAAWALRSPALRALAAGDTDTDASPVTKITLFDPLRGETLPSLLNTLLQGLTGLAIPVVAIMVIIGAYYIITSGGNPGRRTKGKDYILWSAIGFALLLLATSVTTIITNWLKAPAP